VAGPPRYKVYFRKPVVQFSTTVIGEDSTALSVTVSIRNLPSAATSYGKYPIVWVSNNATAGPGSNVAAVDFTGTAIILLSSAM